MLITCVPIIAQAETSGQCGDNVYWNLDDAGTLTISGEGDMWDYDTSISPWYQSDSLAAIEITDGVTCVGSYAFWECKKLTKVILPDSITKIRDGAFCECSALNSISIPNNVNSIGIFSFAWCSALNEVTIPNGVKTISDSAFCACDGLTSIIMSDSVTDIGDNAFSGCSNLINIAMPNNLERIGVSIFYKTAFYKDEKNWDGCVLYAGKYLVDVKSDISGEYTIKNGTVLLEDQAFSNCKNLTSITIPYGITSIGSQAFSGCDNLTNVDIPDSVTTIGYMAFKDCKSLISVEVPNSITTIGSHAYYGCTNLNSVTMSNNITTIDESTFSGCKNLISIDIPNSVENIGNWAFQECNSLTNIIIPDSVVNIGNRAFAKCTALKHINIPASVEHIGSRIFMDCTNLNCIEVDEANNNYCSVDESLFDKAKTKLIQYAFWKKDKYYTIPENVVSIEDGAFYKSGYLKEVVMPSNLKNIGSSAFQDCSGLSKADIPESVVDIGSGAFYNCNNLTSIVIPTYVTSISYEMCRGCTALKDVLISGNPNEIKAYAFKDCSRLENINIPDGVKKIGYDAFYDCDSLNNIVVPDSVTEIGASAFYDCDNLSSVTLSKNLTSLGGDVFAYTRLSNIVFPNSIKYIGDSAFAHSPLKNVVLPESLERLGVKVFDYTPVKELIIPDKVTKIEDRAFELGEIETIKLGKGVKSIGRSAFYKCYPIKSIVIPKSLESVGPNAFAFCSGLKDVYYEGTKEDWEKIKMESSLWGNALETATIHYNSSGPIITNHTPTRRSRLWLNANGINKTYLSIGQTYQSGIQAYPLTAYPTSGVTWHSTNPQVATVSQNGLITGITEGNANIYITTAEGITSDAMNVVVTDLSRFSKSITYTNKVSQIGYGSNYEWIIKNNNFLYWQAFVKNDTNAVKYYYQNALCAPLFDMSEMKNLYSGECSVERAKEILLGFAADSYDDTFKTVKKNLSYKIGKNAVDSLAGYFDNNISTEYAKKLNDLGEENILAAFDNGGYDGAITTISNYLEPNNPKKVEDAFFKWLALDKASECFKVLSTAIDIQNDISKVGNEILDIEVAAETGEAYIDMLNCLEQTCISSNVRRAASEIKKEMKNTISQNILTLGSKIAANKVQDKVIEKSFDNVFKAITGGNFFIKLGKDLGVFVSNELLHAKDFLKCSDNVRLTAYMSVAMTSNITDLHNKFINESNIVKKEDYAKKLIEQYNLLIEARKIGEENYYQTYKYNPVNYLKIKELFGFQSADYEQWYSDTISWLNAAKDNPEQSKPTRLNPDYAVPTAELYSVSNKISLNSETSTPYTAEEFYALFADKGFADAVLYSLGTDSENPDWNIVTHEAVEQLNILTSENQNSISDISGISTLKNLQYLDLSNQRVHSISEDILQLEKLKSINLFNNGLTEYPAILNDISSIQSIVLSYNLLTESPEIIDTIEVDLTGNLLNPNEYLSQRYLYCEMPIIYNSNTNLYDMVRLKDIYGCEFDYNGDNLFVDGTPVSEYDFLNTDAEIVTISVNYSDNPNAQVGIAVDISDTTEYTEESFANDFPDENLRNSVLSALSIDKKNIDYSKITPVSLAEINVIDVDGAVDLKGIELLKGLNKLNANNSKFETIPRYLSILSNLQTLSLRGSDISSLDGITALKALDNLDISECNNLTDISDIKNISNLETLYADGLEMSNILDIVQEMPTVRTLSVGGNCIENIECILDHSFNYLNIQGNYIDEEALKSECLPQLMSVCNTLSYSPQINSLVSDVAVSGNTATVTIKNDTGAIFENVTLITAHYRDGVFIGCDTQDIPLIKVDETLNVDMTLNDILQDDEIKCFVWNSLDSMVPISREHKGVKIK